MAQANSLIGIAGSCLLTTLKLFATVPLTIIPATGHRKQPAELILGARMRLSA
jgi:hypothetical protein